MIYLKDHSISPFTREIIKTYQKDAKLTGEDANIASLFYILATKDMRKELRLHSIVNNLTGAGKSALVEALLKPFRQVDAEGVIDIVRLTGPALERFEGSLDGKILYLSQALGNEPTSIRPMLSEGKLGLMVSEKKEGSSKFETKIINVQGMPAFVSTTTNQALDPELVRRVIVRTVDESPKQTKAVLRLQARQFSSLEPGSITKFSFLTDILARLTTSSLDKLLGTTGLSSVDRVIIPFAEAIEEKMPDDLQMRSNFPKFLKLIAAITLVKSACYRGFYQVELEPSPPLKAGLSQTIAIATEEDFRDAYFAAGPSFFQQLPASQAMMLDYLSNQLEKDGVEYSKLSVRQIMQALRLGKETVRNNGIALADLGLISREETEGGNGVRSHIELQFIKQPLTVDLDIVEVSPEEWLKDNCKSFSKIPISAPLGGWSTVPLEREFPRGPSTTKHNGSTVSDLADILPLGREIPILADIQSNGRPGYCVDCDTEYGSVISEHVQLVHKGLKA